jgi:hypothetical protein
MSGPIGWGRVAAILMLAVLVPLEANAQSASEEKAPGWWERLQFSGDLRGRYEGFFQEEREDRHRLRYRLRLGLRTEILPTLSVGVRVASGDPNDPTSTNESFGDFLGRDPFYVDQVYLLFRPRGSNVTFGGGKFAFPIERTQMTWDDDLNWEGLYQQWSPNSGAAALRFVAVQSMLAERSGGDDAMMFAAAGQARWTAGRHELVVSLADYGFREVDLVAQAHASGDLTSQNTNLLIRDAAGAPVAFASRFNLVDFIVRATLVTPRQQYPVQVVFDIVKNTRATDDEDLGVMAGVTYGRATEPRTWAAGYTFARIERDAVVSSFAFSDIPASNVRLHRVSWSIGLARRVALDVTGLFTKRLIVAAGAGNVLLTRLQGDLRVGF